MSDKRIKKAVKRFMNKIPFKQVDSFEEADILLLFDRNNLQRYNVMMKEDHIVDLLFSLPNNFKIYYFKSTNPHNNKLTSVGFIKHSCN